MEQKSLQAKVEVLKQAQEQVDAIRKQAQDQLTAARQEAQQQITALQDEAAQQLSLLQQDKDQQIAQLNKEKAEQLASAQKDAAEQISAIQQQAAEQISAVQQQTTEQLAEAQQKLSQITEAANAEVATYKQRVLEFEAMVAQPLKSSRENLRSSLMLIAEQIQLLKENVESLNSDNNYHNTTVHMAIKFSQFMQWFDKTVMKDEEGAIRSTSDLCALMQNELRNAIENNYSWASELLRINAYSGISPLFLTEAKRSGILIENMHIAVAELIGLLGKYGITVVIPNLFVDDFSADNYKLNNAPLINSFYPHGFKEQEMAKRGVIYDVIHPGYSVDGVVQKVPEVSAMMAVAQ